MKILSSALNMTVVAAFVALMMGFPVITAYSTEVSPARLTTFEGHLAIYGPCQEDLTHGVTCSYRVIDGSEVGTEPTQTYSY